MDTKTAAALNRINQRFYARHADGFSETRKQAWPGWERVLTRFEARPAAHDRSGRLWTILDVGCGNGRFERFLASRSRDPYHYLGVDASAELLAVAKKRPRLLEREHRVFRHCDLVTGNLESTLKERLFEMIVAFGVLHHIPGYDRRRLLLATLAEHLAPGGLMALSFWQFGADERLRRRIVPWAEHNRLSRDRIDIESLEPGDLLLAWGPATARSPADDELGPRRYCHLANPEEALELVASLGLLQVDHFRSDGRGEDLNLYYLLEAEE